MKLRLPMAAMVIIVFSLFCVATAEAQSAKGRGRISGYVVDEAGNPIIKAKVVIEFVGGDGTQYETDTNKKGEWSYLGLGTGVWRFTATAEGFVGTYAETYVRQLEKNPKVTITLTKATNMAGGIIEDEESFSLLEDGNELFEARKFEEALEAYQKFMEKNPAAYQVRLSIGSCYREIGENDKAMAEFEAILEKTSQETASGKELAAKALAGIGEIYLKQDNFEKAQEYFKQSVDTFSDNEVIAYNVGEIYFSNNKLDEALRYFTMASGIKPDWSDAEYKLGLVHLNKGDYEKAKEHLNRFLALEPDTGRADSVRAILAQIK